MLETNVKISAASGRTIEAFQQLIQQRIKWCNETKEDAVAAIAITALRSIRAATRVADENKIPDIAVEVAHLLPSYTAKGKHKVPCLRNAGNVRYTLGANERLLIADMPDKGVFVFKYVDKIRKDRPLTYYIIASNYDRAVEAVKKRLANRIKAWKGLARKALSVLMTKTCTLNDNDQANQNVTQKANALTRKTEIKGGQTYQLDLSDMLDYATLAVEGGDGIVDMSLKKAANKAVSVINMKCKKILNFEQLDTPFPEVSKKRK